MPSRTIVKCIQPGVGNAFLQQIGSAKFGGMGAQANTAGALIIRQGETKIPPIRWVVLFDCGHGVVQGLIDRDIPWVTHLFLSHSHLDHLLEIDALVNGQRRTGGPIPLPCYCTEGTWKGGPGSHFPYLAPRQLQFMPATPLEPISLDLGINLRVTPVPVWHGPRALDAVIWVLQFGGTEGRRPWKLVLAWDLLHLIPRYPGEDADLAYDAHFGGNGPRATGEQLGEIHRDLFKDVDELYLEGNTRRPHPETGHTCIETGLHFYIPKIAPKCAWIVHYSGVEDSSGPFAADQLQEWIAERNNGFKVRVAREGMERVFDFDPGHVAAP